MKQLRMFWRLWAKALGEKAHKEDGVADQVAILRTVIFISYLLTNCFIVAGVIRHWDDKDIKVNVDLYQYPIKRDVDVEAYKNLSYYERNRNYTGEFE